MQIIAQWVPRSCVGNSKCQMSIQLRLCWSRTRFWCLAERRCRRLATSEIGMQ